MTALTKNSPMSVELGELGAAPVKASTTIYEGALVGIDLSTGYARPLEAGDLFIGHAIEKADNSSGANGDINVTVRQKAYSAESTLTGVAVTDIGKEVFATDDNVLTLTPSGTRVGIVRRYVTTNTAIVEFQPEAVLEPFVAEIDCGLASAADAVTLVPGYMNRRGLVVLGIYGIVTEQFAGSTEDQGIITVKDSDGNALGTLTATDAGADAVNDVIVGSNNEVIGATSGDAVKVLAADKGITAVATQLTSGTGLAGKMKVFALVKFL